MSRFLALAIIASFQILFNLLIIKTRVDSFRITEQELHCIRSLSICCSVTRVVQACQSEVLSTTGNEGGGGEGEEGRLIYGPVAG
jgi:hypothetical protein